MASEKKKPIVSFGPYASGGGSTVECAVWLNEGKGEHEGKSFYGVSLHRRYFNGQDAAGKDRWEDSKGSHRLQDIPVIRHALSQAETWIRERLVFDKKEGRNGQEEEVVADDF